MWRDSNFADVAALDSDTGTPLVIEPPLSSMPESFTAYAVFPLGEP